MSPPPREARRSVSPDRNNNNDHNSSSSGNNNGSFRVIVVQGLSRNVLGSHLREIFGTYGRVTGLDLPIFKVCEYFADVQGESVFHSKGVVSARHY